MTTAFRTYSHEHGGRVLLLFLLFLLALYNLATSGLNSFAIICCIPFILVSIYIAFKWPYIVFWSLFLINYNVQFFSFNQLLPEAMPLSAYNELFEIALIAIAIIDFRRDRYWGRSMNLMAFAISLWILLCALEVFNDTCSLGINVGAWFTGFRLMAFQLVYFLILFVKFLNLFHLSPFS